MNEFDQDNLEPKKNFWDRPFGLSKSAFIVIVALVLVNLTIITFIIFDTKTTKVKYVYDYSRPKKEEPKIENVNPEPVKTEEEKGLEKNEIKEEIAKANPEIKKEEVKKDTPQIKTENIKAGSTSSGDYYIQAGAFTLEENATKLIRKLNSLGYSARKGRSISKGTEWHYVFVDGFNSRQEAENASDNLLNEGIEALVKRR